MCGAFNYDVRYINSVIRVSMTRYQMTRLEYVQAFYDNNIVTLDRMCVNSKQGDIINEATQKLHKIAFVTFSRNRVIHTLKKGDRVPLSKNDVIKHAALGQQLVEKYAAHESGHDAFVLVHMRSANKKTFTEKINKRLIHKSSQPTTPSKQAH